ncbi:MAG: hypothetical protein ACQGVK_05810 [Myxococcota bacterium]
MPISSISRSVGRMAAGTIVSLLIALPVSAADLTGTWKGSFKCSSLQNDGTANDFKEKKSVLKIIQYEDGTFDADIDNFPYCGRMIESKKNKKKGVGVLIGPDTDDDPETYSEMEHLTWKLNSGKKKSDKISKKGVWVDGESIGECTGSWKRTDKQSPEILFFSCFIEDEL